LRNHYKPKELYEKEIIMARTAKISAIAAVETLTSNATSSKKENTMKTNAIEIIFTPAKSLVAIVNPATPAVVVPEVAVEAVAPKRTRKARVVAPVVVAVVEEPKKRTRKTNKIATPVEVAEVVVVAPKRERKAKVGVNFENELGMIFKPASQFKKALSATPVVEVEAVAPKRTRKSSKIATPAVEVAEVVVETPKRGRKARVAVEVEVVAAPVSAKVISMDEHRARRSMKALAEVSEKIISADSEKAAKKFFKKYVAEVGIEDAARNLRYILRKLNSEKATELFAQYSVNQ
jgi:hypothetical protein